MELFNEIIFFFNQNKTMLVWALNSKEPNFYSDENISEL